MIPWTCKNRDAQTVWGRLQSHCWSLNPHPTRMSQRFPLPHYPVFQMVSCHVYNEDTWLYFTVKVALHVQQFETRPYQMFSFFLIISFHTYSCATICSVGEKTHPLEWIDVLRHVWRQMNFSVLLKVVSQWLTLFLYLCFLPMACWAFFLFHSFFSQNYKNKNKPKIINSTCVERCYY